MKKLGNIPPAPGGAVTGAEEPREPVIQMLAPESESDFAASLPDSTSQPEDVSPKRKRRTKAEMDAIRGSQPASSPTAQVVDARLEKAKKKFTSLGAGHTIKAGFLMAKKPLDAPEQEDVDDYFYLVGHKGGLDPTQSWFTMFFCFFLLLCRLIFVRTDLGDNIKEFFFPTEKKDDKKNNAKTDSH